MNSFLDLLEFKCHWQHEGCNHTPKFGELINHLQNCDTHFCLICREVRGKDHTKVVCLQGILAKILKWIDKILLKSEEFQDEIREYINCKPENKID